MGDIDWLPEVRDFCNRSAACTDSAGIDNVGIERIPTHLMRLAYDFYHATESAHPSTFAPSRSRRSIAEIDSILLMVKEKIRLNIDSDWIDDEEREILKAESESSIFNWSIDGAEAALTILYSAVGLGSSKVADRLLIGNIIFLTPVYLSNAIAAFGLSRLNAAIATFETDGRDKALMKLNHLHTFHADISGIIRETLNQFVSVETQRSRRRFAARLGHTSTPKSAAKNLVRQCFDDWLTAPARYKSSAAFARDMLDKFPDTLTSQPVIEAWVREWRKPIA